MIISEFLPAVEFVLANEGGYSNNPHDTGGATNYGITQRTWISYLMRRSNIRAPSHVKDITKADAIDCYKVMFWDGKLYDKIICQKLCNYIFDMIVNHGDNQGIKLVQRALFAVNHKFKFIEDDGILGNKTLDEINNASAVLIAPLMAERAGFYRGLAAHDASQKVFLNGWLNRCYRIN